MSAIPPGASDALLDQDTPDTIRLSVADATALGERALRGVGLPDDDVRIIVDQLIDNALCGYPFASLPRILAIAQDAKMRQPRQPVRVVHETPCRRCSMAGTTSAMWQCIAPPERAFR